MTRTGDRSRPHYDLLAYEELDGLPSLMTADERKVYERAKTGASLDRAALAVARGLVSKGWLSVNGPSFAVRGDPDATRESSLLWLPNAVVSGAGKETPPVELLRQTQDPMTLRLFVDLYFAQNLREDGGISRRHLYQTFGREKAGQQGAHTVWSFSTVQTWVRWTEIFRCHRRDLTAEEARAQMNPGGDLFPRLACLEQLHLLDWIPTLVESKADDAEPIHPCGLGATDALEDRLGAAAREAGARLLTAAQQARLATHGLPALLVPVASHLERVELFGVARLRYRPRTKLTAAWWAELQTKGEKWIATYEAIGRSEPLRILNECANL